MQTPDTFVLGGGMNLVTPAIAVEPGAAIGGFNYEPDAAGYRRFAGFERLDGRPKPSLASYWVLGFDAGDTAVVAGDTVTGATSGATAIAVIDGILDSGTYGGSDAAGSLILMNMTGDFEDDEDLQVSAVTVALADGVADAGGADNDADDIAWTAAAVALRRSVIAKPAGEGPVRGVCYYAGASYAVRDAVGGASAVLFKATTGGWVAQSLGHYIAFTLGTAEFLEGETLTRGGVTATIERVIIMSGTWAGGDAAGRLVLSDISGGTYTAGVGTSASGSATLSGAQVEHVLPPGGRYEFEVHNFTGAAGAARLYGANGVGRGFQWDGAVFSWIWTGLSDALDKPQHVIEFADHLWLGYVAGSWLISGIGEPLDWRTTAGAGEIAVGAEVTGATRTASVLVLYATTRIDYITGSDTTTFQSLPVSADSGAARWTAQLADEPIYMDAGAIRNLSTTEALGGWRMGAKSRAIEPLIKLMTKRGAVPVASMRVRALDLYRVLMSDGTGITMHINGSKPQLMPLELPFVAACSWSGAGDAGAELLLVGDSTGWVYEIDAGVDFDGEELEAMVRLAFYSARSPRYNKRWHTAHLEMSGPPSATIAITAEADYGSPALPPAVTTDFIIKGGGGFWDTAFWNNFYWSAPDVGQGSARLDTYGRNVSCAIRTAATGEAPHTLSALTLNWTARKMVRTNA